MRGDDDGRASRVDQFEQLDDFRRPLGVEIPRRFIGEHHVQLFLLPVLWFSGLGIYLGRELRFNSWDILAAPGRLLEEIVDIFLLRSYFPEAFYFTMLFFAFMWVTYTAWKLKLGVLVIPQKTEE